MSTTCRRWLRDVLIASAATVLLIAAGVLPVAAEAVGLVAPVDAACAPPGPCDPAAP